LRISHLSFDNNVFLAPMAGVTDIAFRGLCKEMGCGLVYTEMVSARALYYDSKNTKEMLRVSEEEKPVAVQIFGNEPYIMAKICDSFFNNNDDICLVDINMGCPAPKIVRNGEGSALMKVPELAASIVREVKKASSKPVTVKFRKGFCEGKENAVEFAKAMEDAGADAITVHGRTREQMYEGKADWDIIAKVKKAVSIPVIGNGDVKSAEDAKKLIELSNCDGLMIARGSQGNPWVFREVLQGLRGENIIYPSNKEKIDLCLRHYELSLKYYDENKAVREMRKHIAWYIKGMPDCAEIKNEINYETNSSKVIVMLKSYKESLDTVE
jgi:tRNA-dihydrouridine synthase B